MQHIISVADAKISNDPQSVPITYALGSCLGITAYDDSTRIGGLLGVMMPLSIIETMREKKPLPAKTQPPASGTVERS